ncbi:SURF1 family protein [Erythrobacter sp. EC-HK427]|uniref:SURF1 family protein n=1 Tax=Erythrobacter sp. EC-HK427 TaxID=2038396 RepID=UPI0012548C4D|nr:SURF1 family protein [Erythrobacter sp. EC-HK427]VVT11913.1 SURF1-like protein [Erythrobacter sp. EC-HK427]
MTWRDVPVLPTIVVLAAVATMIALGVWQLGRADEKNALVARYEAAIADTELVTFPVASQSAAESVLYRQSRIDCAFSSQPRSVAGRSESGRSGYVHIFLCGINNGPPSADRTAYVQIGWSESPNAPAWQGGEVRGRIAPNREGFAKLVADPPLAGLEPSAQPDPNDIPNNHLAYAGQWFLFALTALLIYGFALRSKLRAKRKGAGGQE